MASQRINGSTDEFECVFVAGICLVVVVRSSLGLIHDVSVPNITATGDCFIQRRSHCRRRRCVLVIEYNCTVRTWLSRSSCGMVPVITRLGILQDGAQV